MLAREHVSMQGTQAREYVSTEGMLAREHVSTQGTLVREYVITQVTLTREHVSTQGALTREHVKHAIQQTPKFIDFPSIAKLAKAILMSSKHFICRKLEVILLLLPLIFELMGLLLYQKIKCQAIRIS